MAAVQLFLLLVLPWTCSSVSETHASPPYTEKHIVQYVDHFSYLDQRTFEERYLVTDEYWKDSGPLFFYTGNEAPIETFYDNSGFVFELAEDFNALVVFAEHRYYGNSLPFGSSTFAPENMGFLSAEQALADYAVLIQQLKMEYAIKKVVSFGGSYGGMLSAWFRFKYPNVVDGALAASAPIYIVANLTSPTAFFGLVTKDFERVDPQCPVLVREAFSQILQLAKEGETGLQRITQSMNLCDMLTVDKVEHLLGWVRVSFTSLAMVDYPYPASFLAPLPAYPVNVSCHALLNDKEDSLRGLAQAAGLFYNGTTGHLKCFNITEEFIECADPTGCGTGPASICADYQACTEMTSFFQSTNNVTDMFPPMVYNTTEYCRRRWGVDIGSREGWMKTHFWGKVILSASNIIFSNGNIDPFSTAGVLHSPSESLIAIVIDGAAHHLDLRATNVHDPPALTEARAQEKSIIHKWLNS